MVQWLRNLFGATPPAKGAARKALARASVPVAAPAAVSAAVPAAPSATISETRSARTPVEVAQPAASDAASGKTPAATRVAAPIGISWLTREDINADFNNWLFVRRDYSDLQTTRAEQQILESLDQILASPQSGVQLVRRMPGVIPQLLQTLRTNDFSGAELSRKISHDVVLVAEVIRLANSSLYAKNDPITSIEHAVMVLGQNGLRHLITSVAFRPIIDPKSGHFNRLLAPRIWCHSEQCAIASRLLAQQVGLHTFEAFLAGLIQNVGLMVALRVMDQSAEDSAALGSAAFCNALIPKARKLSSSIGREWNFPEEVITAIDEQSIVQRNIPLSTVGRNLSMADYLSKLNLLAQQGKQPLNATATDGLSQAELACYAELQALTLTAAP